jgi:peptide/nickel transport system permease protein
MTEAIILDERQEVFEEQTLPRTRVRGYWQSVFYRLRHDPVTVVFGALVLLIVLAAVFAPLLAPFDPYKESIVGRLKPFGWRDHPLGTDELGRDMLSRLLFGGRVSLLMGIVPVLIASLVGGMLGVIGGFVGGRPGRWAAAWVTVCRR